VDWISLYGHNIYIDDTLVGYISGNQKDGNAILFVSGRRFADLTAEGDILINGAKVGNIDSSGDVFLKKRLVVEVNAKNDISFYV
jgi:hypothetical protein